MTGPESLTSQLQDQHGGKVQKVFTSVLLKTTQSTELLLGSFGKTTVQLLMVLVWAPRWSSTSPRGPSWRRLVPGGSCGSWRCWTGWGTYWTPNQCGCEASEAWREAEVRLTDSLCCSQESRSGSWQGCRMRSGRWGLSLLVDWAGLCLLVVSSKQKVFLDFHPEFGLDWRVGSDRSLLGLETGWRLVHLLETEKQVMCCSSGSQTVWLVQRQWSQSADPTTLWGSDVTRQDWTWTHVGCGQKTA